MRFMKIILIILAIIFFQSPANSQNRYKYKERGNRYEGIEPVGVRAPDLELLSFIGHREKIHPKSDVNLKLKFYMNADSNLFITAKELIYRKSYLMKPIKIDWNKGWQTFSPWPTKEIINPLELKVDEIGVVGRLHHDRIGSGYIVPIMLYHSKLVYKINQYDFRLRPKRTLSYVKYALYKAGNNQPIQEDILREPLPAMKPFSIILDFSDQDAGEYTLIVNCRIRNEFGGPNRTYTFYHNPYVY